MVRVIGRVGDVVGASVVEGVCVCGLLAVAKGGFGRVGIDGGVGLARDVVA